MPRSTIASSRFTSPLSTKLDRKLIAYAAAAGFGVLVAPRTAEAKIVYTPANVTGVLDLPLDLNGDGITDVTIKWVAGSHSGFIYGRIPAGNAVRLNNSNFAAAGFRGIPVGPGARFTTGTFVRLGGAGGYGGQSGFSSGPWIDGQTHYLGVKFMIAGKIHYGWARLNDGITLSGFAYETVPDKAIVDGQTFGPSQAGNVVSADLPAPSPQPATLGMLARGADGLGLWRRENENCPTFSVVIPARG